MNTQKLTQKSIEVIQKAQSIAIDNQNQQIEQVHILVALLTVDDSLIKQILKRMKVNDNFENSVMDEVRKLPKVMGSRKMDSVYVAQDVDEMLNDAEKIAEKAKKKGMTFLEVEKNRMLLTCAGVSAEKYEDAMKLLRECTEKGIY